MTRPWLFVFGAITGSVVALLGGTAVVLWLQSPTRQLKQAAGLDLGIPVRLAFERDEHDQFLGQGFTLRIFDVAAGGDTGFGVRCPATFSAQRLEASEMWSRLSGLGIRGSTPVCIKDIEETNRQDIVAVSRDRVLHMRIDR